MPQVNEFSWLFISFSFLIFFLFVFFSISFTYSHVKFFPLKFSFYFFELV